MKKLTDVYIKVTKQNQEELQDLLNRKLKINEEILFSNDCKESQYIGLPLNNEKKVSLTELKRLIDTIPTREEIKRLKAQVSAYKMNYDKVVKHSLSKENVIEELQYNNSELIQKLFKANREIKTKFTENYKLKDDIKKVRCERDSLNASFKSINEMYDDLVVESGKKQNLLKNLYDDALLNIESLEKKLNIQADLIRDKNAQLEQLKQRKWWQIWN